MSGLAGLLAGHTSPGIYQWHSGLNVPDVEHAVDHAGWKFVHLDGWAVEEKETFLKSVASAFAFPDSPENFDALSDALADVTAGDTNGTVFLWDGWGPLARADERAFSVALSVLGGRVHADRGGSFAVLLRGEGPLIDVPDLNPHAG